MNHANNRLKAVCSGNIHAAVDMLHEPLRSFVSQKDRKLRLKIKDIKTMDFSQLLNCIVTNWTGNFEKHCPADLIKAARRCITIRNIIAHQKFEMKNYYLFTNEMKQLAALINEPEVEKEIVSLHDVVDFEKYSIVQMEELKNEGDKYFGENRWIEALYYFTKATMFDPCNAALYYNLAMCNYHLERYIRAIEYANQAIEIDSSEIKYFLICSAALLKANLFEESIKVCKKRLTIDTKNDVLSKNPLHAVLYFYLALCNLQLRRYHIAVEYANKAIDIDSLEIRYYHVCSDALLKANLFEESIKICKKGLTIDTKDDVLFKNPQHAVLYFNLAWCNFQLGRYHIAVEYANKAIDIDPSEIKYYHVCSDALLKANLFEESIKICKKGLTIDTKDDVFFKNPQHAVLYYNQAWCNFQLRRYRLAVEYSNKATDIDSIGIKFNDVHSGPLLKIRMFNEWIKICKKGLTMTPMDDKLLSDAECAHTFCWSLTLLPKVLDKVSDNLEENVPLITEHILIPTLYLNSTLFKKKYDRDGGI